MGGFVGFVQRGVEPEHLGRMMDRVAHRGPDGEGRWTGRLGDWFVALGHRRLAILDVAGGAQPMSTPSGSAHLAVDGEIYNFAQLKEPLERRGTSFRTRSDAEVLLYHVEAHGTGGLSVLSGMFAFAQWDERRGKLLLARDRVGIKPLFYAPLPDGGVVFGSELTAVIQHPAVGRILSAAGLESYLFSEYVSAPLSLIEGVFKLLPGHSLEWEAGKLSQPRAFFDVVPAHDSAHTAHPRGLARELWSHLRAAVGRQMIADAPVGVLLGGDLDSSIVATLALEYAGQPLRTFGVAFDDPALDESTYARQVARRIGSEHVEERLSEASLLEVIDTALSRLDEPLADPSYLLAYVLGRLAASQVKVVLGSEGGDELFGGHTTYGAHGLAAVYARLPRQVRTGVVEGLAQRFKEDDSSASVGWRLKRFTRRWDDDLLVRHLRWMCNLDLPELRRAIPGARGLLPEPLQRVVQGLPSSTNGLMALDFVTYLPGLVLAKADRASMAHGLEARPALLDNEIVEFSRALAAAHKVGVGKSKVLLRQAARGHVPDPILGRSERRRGVPLSAWLRGPLRGRLERALEPSPLWASGLLSRGAFVDWSRQLQARIGDHSRALWALVVLDEWMRREKVAVPSAA